MTTENTTTTVEIHANACETTPISWWGWPDEARLAVFAAQVDRAVETDREEEADRKPENSPEYAALYFVS